MNPLVRRYLKTAIAFLLVEQIERPFSRLVPYDDFPKHVRVIDFEGSEVDFLAKFKGMPEDQVRGMLEHVTGAAAEIGLNYDFDSLQHTRTVKAHELLHFAKANGRQLEMEERLMKAYFEEGRHVGRDEDLADLAAEVGLDRDEVLRSLESGEFLDAVEADQAQAVEFGIRGVPFFVIDGKYGVSGAQAPETFTGVFDRIVEERAEVS